VVFEVLFTDADQQLVAQWTTEVSGQPIALQLGEGVLEFQCPELGLVPGMYYASVAIRERGAPDAIDWQHGAVALRVDPGKMVQGTFYMGHQWTLLTHAHAVGD
jgi:hypothetical protein